MTETQEGRTLGEAHSRGVKSPDPMHIITLVNTGSDPFPLPRLMPKLERGAKWRLLLVQPSHCSGVSGLWDARATLQQ